MELAFNGETSYFRTYISAARFEGFTTVEFEWQGILNAPGDGKASGDFDLLPLMQAAAQYPELRQLMPFTSLNNLCFSRYTDYPFGCDLPSIGYYNGVYTVHGSNAFEVFLKTSDMHEAIRAVIARMPPNYGPSIAGSGPDEP